MKGSLLFLFLQILPPVVLVCDRYAVTKKNCVFTTPNKHRAKFVRHQMKKQGASFCLGYIYCFFGNITVPKLVSGASQEARWSAVYMEDTSMCLGFFLSSSYDQQASKKRGSLVLLLPITVRGTSKRSFSGGW